MAFLELWQELKQNLGGRNEVRTRVSFRKIMGRKENAKNGLLNYFELGIEWR